MQAAHRERHGMSFVDGRRTRLHYLWINMRNKCINPRHPDYRYYGERGIEVCDRWELFRLFAADVGPHPGPGWTLDRIDNDGHYEPGRQMQARNRNYCKLTKIKADEIRNLYVNHHIRQVDLAKLFGVTQGLISQIIRGVAWQ